MKRASAGLALAQILLLVGLVGYVALDVPGPAPVLTVTVPMEPPMSRMAGIGP
jgi:hypothetical protein